MSLDARNASTPLTLMPTSVYKFHHQIALFFPSTLQLLTRFKLFVMRFFLSAALLLFTCGVLALTPAQSDTMENTHSRIMDLMKNKLTDTMMKTTNALSKSTVQDLENASRIRQLALAQFSDASLAILKKGVQDEAIHPIGKETRTQQIIAELITASNGIVKNLNGGLERRELFSGRRVLRNSLGTNAAKKMLHSNAAKIAMKTAVSALFHAAD
jgi:hypothetical protein